MVQLQPAGGQGFTTLSEYQPAKISKTETKNLVVTPNGNLVVLSLYARVAETVLLGERCGGEFAPRRYTFMKHEDGSWQQIAAAYFNASAKLPGGVACAPSGQPERAP